MFIQTQRTVIMSQFLNIQHENNKFSFIFQGFFKGYVLTLAFNPEA